MKSYVLTLGVLGALVAAGFTAGCSDDDAAVTGSAGAGATSGASASSGGEAGSAPATAGGPSAGSSSGGSAGETAEAGAAGMAGSAGEAGSGEAGAPSAAGTGGTGGTAGTAGSGGKGGSGGTGGTAGTAATGGTGGTLGGAGGTGGTAGTGGVAATLYIPASLTCASGNVLAAYTVCRNCHGNPLSTTTTPPLMLVTYADVTTQWKDSSLNWHAGPVPAGASLTSISAQLNQVNGGLMPLNSTTAATFIGTGATNAGTCSPGGTISCKQVLLNWLNAGAPGVTVAGGVCP